MNQRIIVAGIVCKGNAILLGKKAKGQPPYPDVWHTLGGGVNDYERGVELLKSMDYNHDYFISELQRELREEAGIEVDNIRCIVPEVKDTLRVAQTLNKHDKMTSYIFLEYICDWKSGDPKPGDDIAQVKWVDKDELENVPLTPPSKELYSELGWVNAPGTRP